MSYEGFRDGPLLSPYPPCMRVNLLCCVVVGETPAPPFFAAIGLAAVLGLAFLGVRASWIAVVGRNPLTPFSAALRLAAALGLAFLGVRAL